MELQKIAVKFFSQETAPVPLVSFIDIFHRWIQETDGIYHDVADYSHMHDGAGIVLVARDANISIDETGGRRGLLYKQKTPLQGSSGEKLRHVFSAALNCCRKIENETLMAGRISFPATEAEVTIADRLSAPNTDQAYADLKQEIENFAQNFCDRRLISVERNKDPRQCLGLLLRSSGALEE